MPVSSWVSLSSFVPICHTAALTPARHSSVVGGYLHKLQISSLRMSHSPASGQFSPRFSECRTGSFITTGGTTMSLIQIIFRESYLCIFPKWNTKPFTCIVSIHIPGSPEPWAGERCYTHEGKTDRLHVSPFKFFTTGM